MDQKKISKRILTIANGMVTDENDSEDENSEELSPIDIQNLQKIIDVHRSMLKPA